MVPLPPNPDIHPLLRSFKSMASFFVSCYRMHICIGMYIYIPIYNLLSPHDVTCMHVFRADHLARDNQPVCSPPGTATSPALSFAQLSVVLRVELCRAEASRASSLCCLLESLSRTQSRWRDFTAVASAVPRRFHITSKILLNCHIHSEEATYLLQHPEVEHIFCSAR